MSEGTRKRRDFIQNITIVLLSLSAVFLFTQTQVNSLGIGPLSFLADSNLPAGGMPAGQTGLSMAAPVRVADSSPFGRYGSVTLTTASEEFESLRGLLEQALESARTDTAGSEQVFFEALDGTSVYYDFLTPLPLSVLAGLLRSSSEEEISVRRLLVAERGDGVSLYLWDENGGCSRRDTALTRQMLEETVNRYELGGAYFAYESADPHAQAVAPCSLFLEMLPDLPALSVSVPMADTSRLLTEMGFNPNTQNRYLDAGGAEVVMESGRSLRLRSDGTVIYQSGGDPALSVAATDEIPTRLEAAAGVGILLNNLLSDSTGDALLYLESIRQVGSATVLQFGYQVGGVPVRFADGKSAAQVSLSGTSVSAMTLRIRQYSADGTNSLLLPVRQALAIAAQKKGAELFVGYADGGDGAAAAKWLSE